jgi:hypothetical protein
LGDVLGSVVVDLPAQLQQVELNDSFQGCGIPPCTVEISFLFSSASPKLF